MTQRTFDISIARDIMAGNRVGRILTKQGDHVRIMAFDVKGLYQLAGLIDKGDYEHIQKWTQEGKTDFRYNVRTPNDLVLEVEGGEV